MGIPEFGRKVAGVMVTPATALAHDTVYACIRDKAESIGQLPVMLYRRKGDVNQLVLKGREHRIFTKKPNDFQTMGDLVENYVTCLETYGKWFAYVERNDRGSISEIIPFRYQTNVTVNMDLNGNVYYIYTTNDGKPDMGFAGDKIMHIKLNTLDGFTGLSPISAGARSIGVSISQEDHLASLMENGATPKGILTTDNIFKDDNAIQRLKDQWSGYTGTKNAGKTPVLENGMKYQAMSISPADAELLEQRKYSRVGLCSLFRVPPERVGVDSGNKQKDVEQSNTAYMRDSLNSPIVKFEDAMNLILPDGLSIKLDRKGFVQGDRQSQVESISAEFKMGSISLNEMRTDLDRDPIEGGDVHAIDTNNLTFGLPTDIPKLQEQARLAAQPQQPVQVEEEENA